MSLVLILTQISVHSMTASIHLISARGPAVARRGEHPSRTLGSYSVDTLAPAEMVPSGVQWRAEAHSNACHNVPVACSSAATEAPAEQAPCGAHWHAGTSDSA